MRISSCCQCNLLALLSRSDESCGRRPAAEAVPRAVLGTQVSSPPGRAVMRALLCVCACLTMHLLHWFGQPGELREGVSAERGAVRPAVRAADRRAAVCVAPDSLRSGGGRRSAGLEGHRRAHVQRRSGTDSRADAVEHASGRRRQRFSSRNHARAGLAGGGEHSGNKSDERASGPQW